MMLWEIIVGMKPLPFKWIDNNHARFVSLEMNFGIVIENRNIQLQNRIITISNIVFGRLDTSDGPFTSADLNLTLTNNGNIRSIFATVAHAIIANKTRLNELVVLAAGDRARDKRFHLYSLAIADINSELPEYSEIYSIDDSHGNRIIGVSRTKLDEATLTALGKVLGIEK